MTQSRVTQSYKQGVAFMVLGIGLLSTMDALGKWLIENGVHTIQILALRSLIIVPVLLAAYAAKKQLAILVPSRPVAQAVRGLTGFLAPLCFLWVSHRCP